MQRRQLSYAFLFLVLGLVSIGLVSGNDADKREIRRIGIPDGAAGILFQYVLKEKHREPAIQTVHFEPYTLYDCCASAGQYALSSGKLDLAVMCPDAAEALVARDDRYRIVGPIMENSDVIFLHPDADLQAPTIAISQKRKYQQQMVASRFAGRGKCMPMLHSAIPFAYARGVVQGAVLDIVKTHDLSGVAYPAAPTEPGVVTYVLVVRKSIAASNGFTALMADYDRAVQETAHDERLLYLLKRYGSEEYTEGEVAQWKKLHVRFVSPLGNRQSG